MILFDYTDGMHMQVSFRPGTGPTIMLGLAMPLIIIYSCTSKFQNILHNFQLVEDSDNFS